jgi:uncharacterized protein
VIRALDALGHALAVAGSMTWQVTWSLILGFTLSGIVQAVIRRQAVIRLLGDDKPKTLALATGLGAASSSCSYAAVALARALFRQGASFTAAMVFEIASTNLVIELGIILALLLSWQFTLAEFIGGPIMIVLIAVAFRLFVRQRLIQGAREQAGKGLAGSMEGQATVFVEITEATLRALPAILNPGQDGYDDNIVSIPRQAAAVEDLFESPIVPKILP